MRKHRRWATLVAAVTLFAACGDDDSSVPAASSNETTGGTTAVDPGPTVATSAGSSTASRGSEAAEGPQKIVSISPTATEMLFAIGAGDQVVAVDSLSTYPPETADVVTDLSAFEPSVEAIAGYEPDLVVTSDDQVTEQLEALGIEVWVGPAGATLDDAYAQIEQLGAATGHVAEAAGLVADLRTDIAAITASVTPADPAPSVYHELDNTYYSVTSQTFLGQLYSLLGLRNIADLAEGDHGGYPQLSAEAIISSSPDLIFLADGSFGESPETVAARDGWSTITAVQTGNIFVVDGDVASRWGPRVVDYLRFVADRVNAAATVGD